MFPSHQKIRELLVGRRITNVAEVQGSEWAELHIYLDDDTVLIPLIDPEGNGPAVLSHWSADAEEQTMIMAG